MCISQKTNTHKPVHIGGGGWYDGNMREQKIGNFIENIEQKAENIMSDFYQFTHGTRVLLLIERAKDGGNNKEYQRRAMRLVTHNEESLKRALIQMLVLQNTVNSNYRIYMTASPRNMERASYTFKQAMLEADYGGEMDKGYFWERLDDRWISALVKTNPPKNETVFVIDIDTQDTSASLKKVSELNIEVLKQYPTKNGWHIIVKPFNRDLWDIPETEIQIEGLLLLSWI